MPKPTWSDFGSIWKTIREVDVNAIRHEAERAVGVVCVGQPSALWWLDRFLREGPNRYPLVRDPLALVQLAEVSTYLEAVQAADLLVLAVDAAAPLSAAEVAGLERLAATPRPSQVVVLFGEAAGPTTPWAAYLEKGEATLVDPQEPSAAAAVGEIVLAALPAEARLAAARRLPGLRPLFAAHLTGEVSVSNAAVALASGVPSMVPILGIPISAADTIILTKNQALMVYRLALACGAPPDFQRRMIEITPVIGGAVVWRQIAGALVGLVPAYGIVPKTAVAFGGTYVVGLAATRWYETGLLTPAERKRIMAEATAKAREVAGVMAGQARAAGDKAGAQAQGGLQKVAGGAGAVRDRAAKVADGARGTAAKAGAQARDAAQRLRDSSRRITRRTPAAVSEAAGESGHESAGEDGRPTEQ